MMQPADQIAHRAKPLIIHDVTLLDCTGRDPSQHIDVRLESGRIAAIEPKQKRRRSMTTVDGDGLTLMPGLIDAHVHLALVGETGGHLAEHDSWVRHVVRVCGAIRHLLEEGFTTVRDAGGLEPAYANAVRDGEIPGPRILPSGSVLTQTGGHGDKRHANRPHTWENSIPGLVAAPEVVDGPDAVRHAAREQLRRGASQIKLYASGGIMSKTDPLESIQFTRQEIEAAVEAAANWGTYVLAHCHTAPAVLNAIEGGVRSIEHGSIIDRETAERIASTDTFVVPTLLVLERLASSTTLNSDQRAKLAAVSAAAGESIRLLMDVGARVGSGSDITGPTQMDRGRELVLKAAIMGSHEAILSATKVNSELVGMADSIGTVEPGKYADLILVAGHPLDNIELFNDASNVRLVMQAGRIVKDLDGRSSLKGAANSV